MTPITFDEFIACLLELARLDDNKNKVVLSVGTVHGTWDGLTDPYCVHLKDPATEQVSVCYIPSIDRDATGYIKEV